jgi:hypothetical protein
MTPAALAYHRAPGSNDVAASGISAGDGEEERET